MKPDQAVEGDDPPRPPPLTRPRPNGEVLTRSLAVEAEIRALLKLPQDDRLRRTGIRQRGDAQFVTEECLVYLLRDAQARADDRALTTLWRDLLARVQWRIAKRLATLGPEYLEEGHAAVLRDIGRKILDLETDLGDFFQVNFWSAVDRRITTEFRTQRRAKVRSSAEVGLSQLAGEEDTQDAGDEQEGATVARVQWADDQPSALDWLVATEHQEAVGRTLASLPTLVRQAFILRYFEGWQIESKDPDEITISKALNRSGRQVRNYLTKAEERLRALREEA